MLYAEIQTRNVLSSETLFEIHAALDHVSRAWVYGESESVVVDRAFGHLKRSCLDIFKLKLREASEQNSYISRIDTSAIDNGSFDALVKRDWREITTLANDARRSEGQPRIGPDVELFEQWQQVYIKCVEFERKYFLHDAIDWSKARAGWLGFLGGFQGGMIGWAMSTPLESFVKGKWQELRTDSIPIFCILLGIYVGFCTLRKLHLRGINPPLPVDTKKKERERRDLRKDLLDKK